MPASPQLRESVAVARETLATGRDKVRAQHDDGCPGVQTSAALTDVFDRVVLDLFDAASADLRGHTGQSEQQLHRYLALVAHGGYGRRDVAPYSDVDLMLLVAPSAPSGVNDLAQRMLLDLFDAGLKVGHSVRDPKQACSLAFSDASIFTSLAEARFLGGSVRLYTRFYENLRRGAVSRQNRLVSEISHARRDERSQFGETVYLLEPNIKRSQGGLRDIQLLRWIGFARHGQTDPDALQRAGALSPEDRRKLGAAVQYLLRLRNELHFFAGRAQDVFNRAEQLRVAEKWGYADQPGMLAVEQFMRGYFEQTLEVRNTVNHFVAGNRPKTWSSLESVMSHRVEGDFRVGPVHIEATKRGREKLTRDLAQILRLMDLANLYDRRIEHRTWETIRDTMQTGTALEISPGAIHRFLSLLSQPARLAPLLRRLHELRVLERLVPGMGHARCLLQFNQYHKYTVDEHSIRAVECATGFLSRDDLLGETYRGIRDKRLLHLALLMHDLGKGHERDHSEVGKNLASEAAGLLGLSPRESQTLQFLVHRHLEMSTLAFRRDISDPSLVLDFCIRVGSPEVLQMLFVLTCADLAAVGPHVLTKWKLDVLGRLYLKAMRHLSAGRFPVRHHAAEKIREKAVQSVSGKDAAWLQRQIEAFPDVYLESSTASDVVSMMHRLITMPAEGAEAWGQYRAELHAVEYYVATYDQSRPGIFHRIAGELTSRGCNVITAEIHTLADNLVLDRFQVVDGDFDGEPPAQRLEDISAAIARAVRAEQESAPSFRNVWQSEETLRESDLNREPPRVLIDNNTSKFHTIFDIFARDRVGLLYDITKTFSELGLSIAVAKISTHVDQVVDVFYVTQNGEKILAEPRLDEIRGLLLTAVQKG